jgi:hypothetical protein
MYDEQTFVLARGIFRTQMDKTSLPIRIIKLFQRAISKAKGRENALNIVRYAYTLMTSVQIAFVIVSRDAARSVPDVQY